jgi:hypothetical protein
MSKTAYLFPVSVVCACLTLSTGCEVAVEHHQGAVPNTTFQGDGATEADLPTTAYDDTLRRLEMGDFEQHELGVEAVSRVDITHVSDTLTFEMLRLLELKPFDPNDDFSVTAISSERLSTTQQAGALTSDLPCDLEYLAIDDIYSGHPVNPTWVGDANPDYQIYLDIYEKSAEEPIYSLTQNAKQVRTELMGRLHTEETYQVVIEVLNHGTDQRCITSSLLPSYPEDVQN